MKQRLESPVHLLPKQYALIENTHHTELCLAAGVGAGKTFAWVNWHHNRCLRNPQSISWVVAPDYKVSRNVCLDRYLKFLQSIGLLETMHYHVKRTAPYEVKYWFGHTVFFQSAENWAEFVGVEISHASFDECGRSRSEARHELVERLRCPKAKLRQILYTGTPQGLTWYMREFSGDYDYAMKAVYHMASDENVFRPKGYLHQLFATYGHDAALVQAHIFGRFVAIHQDNCYTFRDAIHVGDYPPVALVPTPRLTDVQCPLFLTWDFNVGLITWVAVQQRDGTHYVVKENDRRCLGTSEGCEQFIRDFPPATWGSHEITVYGDASGYHKDTRGQLHDYDIIKGKLQPLYPRLRIMASSHNPSVSTRLDSVNKLLNPKSPSLLIDKSCVKVIESLNITSYDGKGGIAKPPQDTWTHAGDALGYYVCEVAPVVEMSALVGGVVY